MLSLAASRECERRRVVAELDGDWTEATDVGERLSCRIPPGFVVEVGRRRFARSDFSAAEGALSAKHDAASVTRDCDGLMAGGVPRGE